MRYAISVTRKAPITDRFIASQVRHLKSIAKMITPNAPKAAASEGVINPATIPITINTMTDSIGTTSPNSNRTFSPKPRVSTS